MSELAGGIFLDLLCAKDYPQQEPAYQSAMWYHLLWFLVPIVGFALFIDAVRGAHDE